MDKDNNVQLLRLELDKEKEEYLNCFESDLEAVEFEIVTSIDYSDKRKVQIYNEIQSIDERLDIINARVDELNSDIDKLTNHADGLDYMIAVASGIITGVIDSFFVGEFSICNAHDWGKNKVEKFVIFVAQQKGYKGNDLTGAVRYLEKNVIPADKATNDFGGGTYHHLNDFSHHPTIVGLFFSLLTQFTKKIYGTDKWGALNIVSLDENFLYLIGNNLPEKILFGIVNWFFHIVSDIAGSSGKIAEGNFGTGLPGPLVSLLKEISVLPFFKKLDTQGYREFSLWITKLFSGQLTNDVKFDLRTEIGLVHEIGKQVVPVVINECIVRCFYFVRRLILELKNNDVNNISKLKDINWKNTLPIKNRTVERMITIATGTFTVFDIADAAIRSGGFNAACILRVNFVGVGRFAVAVVTDVGMGVKKNKLEKEKISLMGEELKLLNAKVYYKQADMWIAAENVEKTLFEACDMLEKTTIYFYESMNEISNNLNSIGIDIAAAEDKNPGLINDMLDILKWG